MVSTNDENFQINLGKIENVTTGVVETPVTTPQPQTNAAPLENSKKGHPFDFFGGTSWEGKKDNFN